MLEKPDINENAIGERLLGDFGISARHIDFLPIGADEQSAAYRVLARDDMTYFVKLRGGDFAEWLVLLPRFLHDEGIGHIIPPLESATQRLWTELERYKLMVYPYVEGRSVYRRDLSDSQWVELGEMLRRLHVVTLPFNLGESLRVEDFSPRWRQRLRGLMKQIDAGRDIVKDPIARETASFMAGKRGEVAGLLERANRLGQILQDSQHPYVLCHADLHAGNILLGSDDAFYLVDWDDAILAPKERDLMSIGAGLMGSWRQPADETRLFYRGYGETAIDWRAIAYYRYERIIQDIAIYCRQILLSLEGTEDREQGYHYLISNFEPNSTIDLAYFANEAYISGLHNIRPS